MKQMKRLIFLFVSLMPAVVVAAPPIFEANWPSITFNGGVPVGGNANLKIWEDGNYQFTGHFHDSGATSYDTGVMFAVKGHNGYVLTFSNTGRVHGTFESGSRDHDWNVTGKNQYIVDHAREFMGAAWRSKANTSLNLGGLWSSIKTGLGEIAGIIAVVGAL